MDKSESQDGESHMAIEAAVAAARDLARAQRTALAAHPGDRGRSGRLIIGEHARLPREVRIVGARRDTSSEEQLRSHRQRARAQVHLHFSFKFLQ